MRYLNATNTSFGEDRKIYSTADSSASAGQTTFFVSYDSGRVAVFLNGVRLVPVQDYTYTLSGIGSQITLGSGIAANDYLEVIGLQGINAGNGLTEDNFVVGTSSTGSGGSYTNSTTVFPVSHTAGDIVSVWRNGVKLVPTTDYSTSPTTSTVTLVSAATTSDEITVHVIGILQHSNFVQTIGGTFTGTVAHTGTLDVSGGTLTTSTAQKDAIVDGSTAISRSGNDLTFAGDATVTGDLTVSGTTTTIDTTVTASDAVVVNNAGSDVGLKINSTSTGHIMQLQDNGTDVLVVKDGGNVGIGTTTPAAKVTIKIGSGNDALRLMTDGTHGVKPWISFDSGLSGTNYGEKARIQGGYDSATGGSGGYLAFSTKNTSESLTERFSIDSSGHFVPSADNSYNLGSSSKRFANFYTHDLNLNNTGSGGNEVDGTEGSWTIQEGEDNLYLINRKNNKKYKFILEEV